MLARSPLFPLACLLSLSSIAIGSPFSDPPSSPAFPDLSDPKAAAFSLAIALANSDASAAKEAYGGNDKSFVEYLDELAELKASMESLQRAIANKFAFSKSNAFAPAFDAELKVPIGNNPQNKVPLSSIIAMTECKEQGNRASLRITNEIEIRLTKTKAGWKVTNWPSYSQLALLDLKLSEKLSRELTAEIEAGNCKKLYDVVVAANRISRDLYKNHSSNENSKRLDK